MTDFENAPILTADGTIDGKLLVLVLQSTWREMLEIKQSIVRLHDRLDELIKSDFIKRPGCESYRAELKKELMEEINKTRGVPLWIPIVMTISGSLITGLIVKILCS